MEIIFLGTASNNPTPARGVSCACLRFLSEGDLWLIDCGESSQIQTMKTVAVKPGRITKIFLTHLHGDHIFGLPGLLCTIGQNVPDDKKPLEIYGPLGTRRYVRTCLELSRSFMTYPYVVHELVPEFVQIPDEIREWKIVESDDTILHPNEVLGRQISCDTAQIWNLFENENVTVKASWIKHRVATFGYVIEQKPLQGKLDVDGLKRKGIMPGPLYTKIKATGRLEQPDGTTLDLSEFVGAPRPGKKITFLGDCSAVPLSMIAAAQNSDVLVHEATLEDQFSEKAVSNGHSTPSMAALVANQSNARCLILNHFSQRYKPVNYVVDPADDKDNQTPIETVQKLLDEAKLTFTNVLAAYDLFTYKVV